jgi:hypothetical protein
MVKSENLVSITPEAAAAIVRSDYVPKVLKGTGGSKEGVAPTAMISQDDVVDMIRQDQIPQNVRIEGGTD